MIDVWFSKIEQIKTYNREFLQSIVINNLLIGKKEKRKKKKRKGILL